jgi:predicted amidohydrolase YtcJ
MRIRTAGVAILVCLAGVARTAERPGHSRDVQRPAAEVIIVNGRILTVDANDSIAEAIAIRGGKIAAVGSNTDITRFAGPNTAVVDLHGQIATPGLIDSHAHLTSMARLVAWIDLADPSITTIADVAQRVRERVAAAKSGEWVLGKGWDEARFAERREMFASDLDAVSPDNPVFLEHASPRLAVINAAAMRRAGIDRTTADPRAGRIERLPDGTPSGVLRQTAVDIVRPLLPRLSAGQMRTGLLASIAALHKEGMTAIKLPAVDEPDWNQLRRLMEERALDLRIVALWLVSAGADADGVLKSVDELIARLAALKKADSPDSTDRLVSGGVKLLLDGSGLTRTAWMYQDFNRNFTNVDAGNNGVLLIPAATYREAVRRFHNAGIHVATHAIGDRAIDLAVDTYAEVLRAYPRRGLRHAIIHAVLPTDHALDTMVALEKEYDAGYPETQPSFMWWTGDTYAGNLGADRAKRMVPLKTFLDRGIVWASGSDALVTPFPARYGLWASVARKPLLGTYGSEPFGSRESVDVRHALRSYTLWAARQLFLEDRIGSLEPGKDADIAVWDRDPYTVPTDRLRDMSCELTMLGGRIVHKAPVTPITIAARVTSGMKD